MAVPGHVHPEIVERLTGPSSPQRRPDVLGVVLGSVVVTVVAALVLVPLVGPGLGCRGTHGASLQHVRSLVADDHGTDVGRVVAVRQGDDVRTLEVRDGRGQRRDSVRVERATDGEGWVLATAAPCD